jgi:hypothetical protein
MPQPIYLPRKPPSVFSRILPYAMQLGLNMQRQRAVGKERDENREYQTKQAGLERARDRMDRNELLEMKGWRQKVDIDSGKATWQQPKPTFQDIKGMPDHKVMMHNGKATIVKPTKVERPYKLGTVKDFKEGDVWVQKKYTKDGFIPTGKTAKRYKPTTNITNVIKGQEFDIKKDVTFGNMKGDVLKAKTDRPLYESKAGVFNKNNESNEVMYWDTTPGRVFKGKGEAKVIKLPKSALAQGWTPSEIDRASKATGLTIEEILKKGKIIKSSLSSIVV